MERNDIKIDIAEILKDEPKGTKLYCKLIGDCKVDSVSPDGTIQVYNDRNDYVMSIKLFDAKVLAHSLMESVLNMGISVGLGAHIIQVLIVKTFLFSTTIE